MSTSISHMLASIALQTIRENPELLEQFRETCRKTEAPFEAGDVTPMVLELAEAGVNETAMMLMRSAREGREPSVLNIPLPADGDDGRVSSVSLAIGSFAVEHIRVSPERMAALNEWMAAEHPDCGWEPGDFTDDRMEQADRTLTIMAHVTATAMDTGLLDDVQRRAREHRHDEPDGSPARYEPGSYRDDGTRNV